MKVMVCEICGEHDLVKQDGMFVCRTCGTKYSVEEARKLLTEVEGAEVELPQTVESAPVEEVPVRSAKDQELENLYMLARRARADHNSENAQKFYDQIVVKDPTGWEPTFYTVYYQSMNCKIAEIQGAAVRLQNCEDTVLNLIKQHVEGSEAQGEAVRQIAQDLISIGNMLVNSSYNHYNGIGASVRLNYKQELVDRVFASMNMLYNFGDLVNKIFPQEPWLRSVLPDVWKTANTIYKNVSTELIQSAREIAKNKVESYAEKIKKYDSSYTAPVIITAAPQANNSGCGTAIAVISIIIIIIAVIVIATMG